jgi:tRNA 2-thiocytidine biosynthesis protein TtcA
MNLFFRGEIGTAPPALDLFDGEIKIIRPLCYLEKKDVLDFSSQLNLPVTNYSCNYGKDSKRELMKAMIKDLEKDSPYVKKNIFKALGRIKEGYLV